MHQKQSFFQHSIDAILEAEATHWGADFEDAVKSGEVAVELIDTRNSGFGTIEGKFRLTNAGGVFAGWWEDGIGVNDIKWAEATETE